MVQTAVEKAVSQAIKGMEVEMGTLRDEVSVLRQSVEALRKGDCGNSSNFFFNKKLIACSNCLPLDLHVSLDKLNDSDESVARKRLKRDPPRAQSPADLKTTETLSQVSPLTQPDEDSDENFDGTQMTQCSPIQMTQCSPVTSSTGAFLDEESPETGLALALQRPQKHTRAKRCTPATGASTPRA